MRLPAIRNAERHLRERLELPRPFASVHLKTDGVNVLYQASPEVRDQLTAADLAGQEVLAPTIAAAFGTSFTKGWLPFAGAQRTRLS